MADSDLQNCHSCRFLWGFECRRHAPAPLPRDDHGRPNHHDASWPRIYNPGEHWCGDHEPRPQTGTAHA